MKKTSPFKKTLFYICILVFVLFSVGPITWIFLSSLRPKVEFFSIPPTIFPKEWTAINYRDLFVNTDFGSFLLNSIYITIGTILVTTIVAVLAAYSVSRFSYRGRTMFSIFTLFAYMLPPVLLVIPLYVWASEIGLIDTLAGLIVAYVALCLPYCIWTLRSYFSAIPFELEEAAFVDGASRLRTLVSVVLPISVPGLVASTVFVFTYVWNEYLFALVFITSDVKRTFPVGLNSFIMQFDVYWEYILAGSVIVSIPALIVFLLTQKSLIKGIGAGGVKG